MEFEKAKLRDELKKLNKILLGMEYLLLPESEHSGFFKDMLSFNL
ncbi:MAG: hypothetical protein ABSF79_10370 [Smithellaceae bacterium]|jgi:hypothetical protein